jgi:hypothetical protein
MSFSDVLKADEERIMVLRKEYVLDLMKKDILPFLLFRDDETEFFDITPYIKKYGVDIAKESARSLTAFIETVSAFHTEFGYADTAIFVFESEKPENCWG